MVPRKPIRVGTMLNSDVRLRLAGHLVATQLHPENTVRHRETSRPVLSGAGNWPTLLYVWDSNTGHKLLVDTGAQVSVFPASAQERRQQKTVPLVAANGRHLAHKPYH